MKYIPIISQYPPPPTLAEREARIIELTKLHAPYAGSWQSGHPTASVIVNARKYSSVLDAASGTGFSTDSIRRALRGSTKVARNRNGQMEEITASYAKEKTWLPH